MILKKKIDSFCAKEIVLHIPTKDLFIKVCGELKRRGIKWCTDQDADKCPEAWDNFHEETVLCLDDDGMDYCNRSHLKYKVIVKITEDDFKAKLCQDPLKELQEHIKKCDEECVQAWSKIAQSLGVTESPADNVNHPAYYTDGSIEVSDFIADKNLNFFRGNVLKYICRAGKKDPDKEIEDLKKAEWYLNREIDRLEWMNK